MANIKEVIRKNKEMALMLAASFGFAVVGLLIKDYEIVGAGVGGLLSVGILGTMIKLNQHIVDQVIKDLPKSNQN